jgi:hypothetical protein
MALTGIHILLTYACTNECDHCFVYCSPRAPGTFTLDRVREVFDEIPRIGTITGVYFEGGEPFLFYALMMEGIRLARGMGLEVGIVTNGYWAVSPEDAELYLQPFHELGIADLSLSDDSYHYGEADVTPPQHAVAAAQKLGMPAGIIAIGRPTVETPGADEQDRGEPVVGGGTIFRGRAADMLAEGLPRRPWDSFAECSREALADPKRLHVDPYGNVLICQGLSLGNMWKTPLSRLVQDYDGRQHAICGPLLEGGPARLATKYGVSHEGSYVDVCHLCFEARRALIDRFPEYLAPRQVYGLQE